MVKRKSTRLALFLLLAFSPLSLTYFTYDDCGLKCARLNISCTISKITESSFSILCAEKGYCHENANENVPCISEDSPTVGGEALWPLFKAHRIRPQPPTPQEKANCKTWFVVSTIQACISLIFMIWFVVIQIRKYRARLEFDRLSIINHPDNPYMPCAEPIPPEEQD